MDKLISLLFVRMTHSKIQHYGPLVGRVLLALLFIVSGIGILTNVSATAGYYAALGIPAAMAAAVVVLVVKIVGGLMVASGMHAKEGAWALIVFTLITIVVAHTGEGQLIPALKNLAIVGGLLLVAVHGAGSFSMEKKCPCPKHRMKKDGGGSGNDQGSGQGGDQNNN